MDSDDDDFGADFDDTAFLEAATQAEREITPAFHPSPRPLKRRKIQLPDEKTRPTPPRKPSRNKRPRPFLSSDEDEDEDEDEHVEESDELGLDTPDLDDHHTSPATKSVKKRTRSRNQNDDNGRERESPRKEGVAEKRKNRIHQPSVVHDLTDVYLTQPPPEASPPWMPRGAIWKKPGTHIGVHMPAPACAVKTAKSLGSQSTVSRPVPQASKQATSRPPPRPIVLPAAATTNGTSTHYDAARELDDLPSDAFSSSPTSPQEQDDVVLVSERRTRVVAPQAGLRQTTLFGRETVNGQVPQSQANKRYNFIVDQKEEPPTHHKLDPEAIKTWIYPTNLGVIRDYQFNIVARGLFHNLLVALPTGLGKTFVAATIMLNWYRWTTESQIVFLAPTKPLVAQQIDACFHTCGIPRSDTTMLIGGVSPALRAEEWKSKRVFFMTPQTLMIDLKHGYADPKKIVLLVVDEAHRATGNYAYVEVVSFLRRFNTSFRVLALTATPGADVEAVQKVIDGLDISRVEIRTEQSLDIKKYIHHRVVEKHVFSNSEEMQMCMDLYSQALQPTVNTFAGLNAFWSKDPLDLNPFGVRNAVQRWGADAGRMANPGQKGMVHSISLILISISQGMELLKYHGIGPFYVKMKEFKDGSAKSKSKYRDSICNSEPFKKLLVRLETWTKNENFVGHPKMEFLQQAIIEHMVKAGDSTGTDPTKPQSRIMVFAHFRDSAEEIVRVLRRHQPLVRPRVFVGQASGKNSDGMNQKEQLQVIEQFKAGTFNTLVATSIGEEGLDIGDLDLIILYDSKASPIRMLQRMGRTGRKREGKVIFLQMEGKEVNDANKAKESYEVMQQLIAEGSRFNFHDDISRRILPRDVQPVVERRVVEIPFENSQTDWLPVPSKKRAKPLKKPPKKFHMPDGVLTGFVTAGRMDEEIAPRSRTKKAPPVYPSEEILDLPPLESVYLNEKSAHDLKRRYADVLEEDDESIPQLNLRAHPDHQQELSKTHVFQKHGRATESFVKTVQRMRNMDDDRLDEFSDRMRVVDFNKMPADIVVSDADTNPIIVTEDMWADEEPPSQPLPKSRVKPGPKLKPKVVSEPVITEDMWADEDPPSQPLPKSRAKPGPKPKSKPKSKPKAVIEPVVPEDIWAAEDPSSQPLHMSKAQPVPKPKTKADPQPKANSVRKQQVPRSIPHDDPAVTTPVRAPKKKAKTPVTRRPAWRANDSAEEGDSSSPPPTDPRMRIASQADTIGSDDSIGAFQPQDTQAYKLDSDLVSFIAEDDEDVELEAYPTSSLGGMDLTGIGQGTQAVLRAARPKRPKKAEKIFTSDISDDDAVLSSDSDGNTPLRARIGSRPNAGALVVDSEEEEEEDEPVVPMRRARRVIEDDEDDE